MNQDPPTALDPAARPDTITKHAPPPPREPRRSHRGWVWLLFLVLLAIGAYIYWSRKNPGTANGGGAAGARQGQKKGFGAIPVVAAQAHRGNIPVYLTALGTVTPIYTVEVQSRVAGELMKVYYKEGDFVKKGDPLVEIDPRPYEAALTQAEGNLVRDQALLDNARIDLARYKTLLTQNAVPEQQVATQQALVTQDEGIVKTDQGTIETAKLNVTYSHITSPITGRVGLRLVDPGNIIQVPNGSPLLVITQMDPISVIFPISEDQLPPVRQRFSAGQHLNVEAWDRNPPPLAKKLSTGTLATLDNQIDPTTATLRLRANFENKNYSLFPNQFVNVKLLVQMKQNVTLIPTATVQRNSTTTYVFLVQPNHRVTVRAITVGTTEGDETEVTSGLAPGDVIVMTGVDKLQEGTLVSAHMAGSQEATGARGTGAPGSAQTPAGSRQNAPNTGKSDYKGQRKGR